MAELAEKAGGKRGWGPAGDMAAVPKSGIKSFVCEVLSATTTGSVTFATYFGTLASQGCVAVVRVTAIQQDALGTAVGATSWTAAGVATWTTTLVDAKNYYIVFECI